MSSRYVSLRSSAPLAAVALVALLVAGCGDKEVATRTVTVQQPGSGGASSTATTTETTPTTTTPVAPAGFARCDANISAKTGPTTCAFAANAFYEYWRARPASVVEVFSPAAGRRLEARCTTTAGIVSCTTGDGGVARFPQAAVDRYTQAQADRYAATHQTTPTKVSESGGVEAPSETTTTGSGGSEGTGGTPAP